MKRPATSPLAPSSTGRDTSLLSKALRDLSGASNIQDERTWPLLGHVGAIMPPSRAAIQQRRPICEHRHFYQTTGEACKAAVEAYAASLLPSTATCDLVLNMRAPKSSWRTLSELYTLRKLE